ncbi:MAG TPA: nucleotidyl transferase AbiEii/AbiGii toxin family protein [Anaerolineae bacterium]|nr:nucleotidyl transferase AbiEii/AbiGii toxin family protein [Anaerolineae bacterium]
MAVLEHPHWEAIDQPLKEVLDIIGQQPFARRIYLAGGTALALQIGHRRSADLDFFSSEDEFLDPSRREIVSALNRVSRVETREDTIGNLLLYVNGVSTGFFGYGYPLLGEVQLPITIRLASVEDIGLMKLDAIITRGARKDFIDLFCIERHRPLDDLIELWPVKFPRLQSFEMMLLEGLTNHDNAERDTMPEMLIPLEWGEVKAAMLAEARRLGARWFGV